MTARGRYRSLAFVAVLAAGCQKVPPSNPYDLETPASQQAPGRIDGVVYVQGRSARDGVVILLSDSSNTRVDGGNLVTDTDGKFLSQPLVPGLYRVDVEVPAGNSPVQRAGIVVNPGETTSLGLLSSLREQPIGSVFGEVTLDGSVLAPDGVRVVLTRFSDTVSESRTSYVDSSGSYIFPELVSGEYELRADREGFTPDRTTVTIDVATNPEGEAALLRLYPASAVTRFSIHTSSGEVLGAAYTAARDVDLVLLAFGGVNEMRISELADFGESAGAATAWRPFLAQVPVTLSESEGLKRMYAQFRVLDELGNELLRSSVYQTEITYDSSPPVLLSLVLAPSATVVGSTRYYSGSTTAVPFTVAAFDAFASVSGVKVLAVPEDGDAASIPYTLVQNTGGTFSYNDVLPMAAGDGVKTIGVQLIDAAGNESELFTNTVVVDTTPPVLLADPAVVARGALAGDIFSSLVTLQLSAGANELLGIDGPVRMRYGVAPVPVVGATVPYFPEVNLLVSAAHGEAVQFYAVFEDNAGNAVTALSPIYHMNLRGTVSGRVYIEGIAETELQHGGTTVEVFAAGDDPNTATRLAFGTTLNDGSYVISNIPVGTYQVRLQRSGAITQLIAPVSVSAGSITELGIARLILARGNLQGFFVYGDMAPSADHSGISVTAVLNFRTQGSTVTTSDGQALLSSLPVGDVYDIVATAPGYVDTHLTGIAVAQDALTVLNDGNPIPLPRLTGDFKICDRDDPANPPKDCVARLYTNKTQVLLGLDADSVTHVRYTLEDTANPGVDSFLAPLATPAGDPCASPPAEQCWNPYNEATEYLVDISGNGEGQAVVVVQFANGATVQSPGTSSVIYDVTAPTSAAVSIARGSAALVDGFTNSTELSLSLVASASGGAALEFAPVTSVRVSRDPVWDGSGTNGDRELSYGGTKLFTVASGDGDKPVYAWFCDGAGNCTTSPATRSIILDTQPPVRANGRDISPSGPGITLKSLGNREWWSRSTRYGVDIELGTSPYAVAEVAAYRMSLTGQYNGIEWIAVDLSTYGPGSTLTGNGEDLLPVDGEHIVWSQFQDAAGNVSTETNADKMTLVLDTVPPAGTVTIESGVAYTNKTANLAVALTTDGVGGATEIQYSWTGTLPDPYIDARVAYAPLLSLTPPSGDGEKNLIVRFFDAAGNFAERQDSIVIDTEAPMLASVSINGGVTSSRAADGIVTLYLSAVDTGSGVSHMQISSDTTFNETFESYVLSKTFTLDAPLVDGTKHVYVRFRDYAGNATAVTPLASVPHASIILDRTGPVVDGSSVRINNGDTYTATTAVTVDLLATDALTGVASVAVANETSDCSTAAYLPMSPRVTWTLQATQGLRTVVACFKDGAGNASSQSDTITFDSGAPSTLSIQINTNATYATSSAVTLTLAASDTYTSAGDLDMQVSEDPTFAGATVETFATSKSFTLSAGDGAKAVYLRVIDLAGNTATASDTIILDTQAPYAAALTLIPSDVTKSTAITATIGAIGATEMCLWGPISGGSTDDCVSNGWRAFATSTALTLTGADGAKAVSVRFRDAALLTSATATDTVTLDVTVPTSAVATLVMTGTAATGTSTSVTRVPTVNVQLSGFADATAGLSDMMVSESPVFSGAAWQSYASAFTWSLSSGDASKTLYVKVRDAAGNESTPATSGSIQLDTTAPSLAFTIEGIVQAGITDTTLTWSQLVRLALTASDGTGSGLTEMKIARDSGFASAAWTPFATSVPIFDLVDPALQTCRRGIAINEINTVTAAKVELVNFAGRDVSVTGWTLECRYGASAVTWTLPSATLVSGGYLVLDEAAGTNTATHLYGFSGCGWSGALAGSATLRDAAGNAKDFVRFNGSTTAAPSGTFWSADAAVTCNTACGRTNLRFDRDLGSDWCTATASLEAANASACGLSQSQCFAPDGVLPVYAKVRDVAGNETSGFSTITLDMTPPLVPSLSIDEGAYVDAVGINLELAAVGADQMYIAGDVAAAANTFVWTSYNVSQAVSLTTGDGAKNVQVTFRDFAGNASAAVFAGTTLDTQTPTASSVTINGKIRDNASSTTLTGTTAVTLTLASTGADYMLIANDSGFVGSQWEPFAASKPWVLTPSDSASKTVYAQFRDRAGNTTTTITGQIELDTTAPTSPTVSIAGGAELITSPTSVSLTLSAAGSPYEMRTSIDGTFDTEIFVAYGTSATTTFAAGDGAKSVWAQFRDAAGNVSATTTDSVSLDGTAPTPFAFTLEDATSASRTVTDEVAVLARVSATDAASGMNGGFVHIYTSLANCQNHTSPSTYDYAASFAYSLPATDALYTRYIRFADRAGNLSALGSCNVLALRPQIRLDTTVPTLSAVTLRERITNDTVNTNSTLINVASSYSESGSGLDVIMLSEDAAFAGADWVTFASSKAFILSSNNGDKTVYAKVRDRAGWESEVQSDTIVLDTEPPAVPSIAFPGAYVGSTSTTLTLFAEDNLSTPAQMQMCLYGNIVGGSSDSCATTGWVTYATSYAITLTTGAGSKAVTVKYRDAAMNVSTEKSTTVVYDTTAPTAPVIASDTTANASLTLYWTYTSDAESQTSGFRVYYDTNSGSPYSGTGADQGSSPVWVAAGEQSLTLTGLTNFQTYYVSVSAVNGAGVESPLATERVVNVGWRHEYVTDFSQNVFVRISRPVYYRGTVYLAYNIVSFFTGTQEVYLLSSNDWGATWDLHHVALLDEDPNHPFHDSPEVFVNDSFVIVATMDSTVDPPQVAVFKSIDNGITWAKTDIGPICSNGNYGIDIVNMGGAPYIFHSNADGGTCDLEMLAATGDITAWRTIEVAGNNATYETLYDPRATVDASSPSHNRLYVLYSSTDSAHAGNVLLQYSYTNGMSWTAPVEWDVTPSYIGYDIAAAAGYVNAVLVDDSGRLTQRRSTSYGNTFGAETVLATDAAQVAPTVYAEGNMVWIVYRRIDRRLYGMVSSNYGSSWRSFELASPSDDGMVRMSGYAGNTPVVARLVGTALQVHLADVWPPYLQGNPVMTDVASVMWRGAPTTDNYRVYFGDASRVYNTTIDTQAANYDFSFANGKYVGVSSLDAHNNPSAAGPEMHLRPFSHRVVAASAPDTATQYSQDLELSTGRIHVLSPETGAVIYRASVDDGVSFTATTLATATVRDRSLAVDDTNVYAAYCTSAGLMLRKSVNSGVTWDTAVSLDASAGSGCYVDVAAANTSYVMVLYYRSTDLYFVRSIDGGVGFSAPAAILTTNDIGKYVRIGAYTGSGATAGYLFATHYDDTDDEIELLYSANNGTSFTSNVVDSSPSALFATSNISFSALNSYQSIILHHDPALLGLGSNNYIHVSGYRYSATSATMWIDYPFESKQAGYRPTGGNVTMDANGAYFAADYGTFSADMTSIDKDELLLFYCPGPCGNADAWSRTILRSQVPQSVEASYKAAIVKTRSNQIYVLYLEVPQSGTGSLNLLSGGIWRRSF